MMEPSYIEFYCEETEFSLILTVPSMRSKKVYHLTKMRGEADKYDVRYIVLCDCITDAKELVASIRAWLKYEHGVSLNDPQRDTLWGPDRLWAQVRINGYDPHEYDLDYTIESIQ